MPNIKKLHIALNAGDLNRVIYLNNKNKIVIGCFVGTKDEAIKEISNKYKHNKKERDKYIQKVKDCFNGVEYDIDNLINDEDRLVRQTVAEQGYGLDILINDEHYMVKEVARNYIKSLSFIDLCKYIMSGKSSSGGLLAKLSNVYQLIIN